MASYTISVAVTGLTGTLVLVDSKGYTLTFTSNGTQTFNTSYPKGTSYTVSVKTQAANQICILSTTASDPIVSNVTFTAVCTAVAINNLGPTYTSVASVLGQPVVNSPNNKIDVQLTPNLNTTHGVTFVDVNNWGPYFTTM